MQRSFESFYQPYQSDSEDSASITSSDTSDSEESMRLSPIGSTKFLTQVGGINLNPPEKQVDLRIQPRSKGPNRGIEYSAFDLSGEVDKTLPFTGTSFDMTNGTYTSILMINSRDRDTHVYPQPTFFTIRLPRTYRNVTSFQITQMKLLSSFFYFRPDKENVSLSVLEQGRTINVGGTTVDNVIKVTIRTGTYNIDTLLAELQTQLNRTPLFFYYPNGFSDFIVQFTAAGDLSVNFNLPGDTYFNSLNDTFVANPTIDQITQQYFATRYAGLSIYTLNQVKVAYYYPVIYEMLLDPDFENALNLTLSSSGPQLLPGETVRSRILYTFQGLNDLVIQEVINNNLVIPPPGQTITAGSILDYYRTQNTFVYSLVNEYNCTYETNNNRIIISTTRLNTSLFNLLNNQAAIALADTLNTYNLTLAQYSNLLLSNTLYTSVFTNMYNFLQSNMATYFAVNFGTYSPIFYTNVSNTPFLQNGIDAVGVATGYSLALLQSGQEPINSSAQSLQSSPGYWPQIVAPPNNSSNTNDGSNNVIFIGAGMGTRQQDLCANYLNIPYNTIAGTLLTTTQMIDNSGSIYISPTFGAGDCVTPIYNSKYTVFRFRSYVRQTLQVETLPLPYYYRYPDVNKFAFSNTVEYPGIVQHFDLSYSYIDSPYLTRTDISSIPVNFPQSYHTAKANATDFLFSVRNNIKYYQFEAPRPRARNPPNNPLFDASGYKYPMRLNFLATTILGTPIQFPSPIDIYLYHDQGAFYADVSQNRNENPYNYKYTTESSTDLSNAYIDFNAIGGNRYYIIARSRDLSFQNTRIKPFLYFPNEYSTPIVRYVYNRFIDPFLSNVPVDYPATTDASYNQIYAQYYDPDLIRLPTSSNLMGPDPSSAVFNRFLPIFENPIGYDASGVSTDLTDYKGFQSNIDGNYPNKTFSVDPLNKFTFQNLSGYSTSSNSYFYTNSSNAILFPINNRPYIPGTVPYRQTKIVHWYDTNYVAPQISQRGIPNSNFVADSRVFDASYGAILSYTYEASGNIGVPTGGLSLGYGVSAIGFLPNEGTWDVDSFLIKTAYMERPLLASNYTDPNKNIAFLGVFPNNLVQGYFTTDVSLQNAIVRLAYSTSITYTPTEQLINQGFDPTGGTYHYFVKDSTFTKTTNKELTGYTPSVTYGFDSNNYYSLVAFDASGLVVPFYTPMGSYVPYPVVTYPAVKTVFSDNTGTFSINPFQSVGFYVAAEIYPTSNSSLSNYYPTDNNIYQSRYQQSIPIKTSLVTAAAPTNIITYSNSLNYYPVSANPLTTLIPGAYPVGENDIGLTLLFTKGPFFFWTNNQNLDSGTLTITSNWNKGATESNVNFRSQRLIVQVGPMQNIKFSPEIGEYTDARTVLAFTTNSSGTLDTSGIYVLLCSKTNTGSTPIPPPFGPDRTYFYDFVIANLNFDPNSSDPNSVTFSRRYPANNGTYDFRCALLNNPTLADSLLPNSPIYTSFFSYSKFFFREKIGKRGETSVAMFQFTFDEGHDPNGWPGTDFNSNTKSYFGIVDCSSTDCRNMPTVLQRVGFSFSNDWSNPAPSGGYTSLYLNAASCLGSLNGTPGGFYYWDNPTITLTDMGPTPYYPVLDWNLTEDGMLITNNGILLDIGGAGKTQQFLQGSRITSMANEYTSINLSNVASEYPNVQDANVIQYQGANQINQVFGLMNQLNSDMCGNLFIQQAMLPYVTVVAGKAAQIPYGLINAGWSINSMGYFIKISGYKKFFDYNASNIVIAPFGPDGCNAPLMESSAQRVAPCVFDSQFSEGANVICQTLTVPYYKDNPSRQGVFLQICNRQGFYFKSVPFSIIAPLATQRTDISGTYNLELYADFGGFPSFYFLFYDIPATGTATEIENAFLQSIIKYNGYQGNEEGAQSFLNTFPIQVGNVEFNTLSGIYTATYLLGSPLVQLIVQPQPFGSFYYTNNPSIPISTYSVDNSKAVGDDVIDVKYPFVRGNSGYGVDTLPFTLSNTWQMFYPTCKFVLRKIDATSTPITNTIDLIGESNVPPGTFEHTTMFYYDNYTDLSNDIFNKFGQENKARFKNFDVSSGYGFHSYIFNIPLQAYTGPTLDISANENYNYLAVRAYSPCEKFNCLTRFYLPGRYDFGFISLKDLSNETQTVLVELSGSRFVNPTYQFVLNQFNNSFKGPKTFGSNAVPGFNGSNYTFTGFGNFLNTYIQTYNAGNSNAQLLATITSNVNQKVSAYIQTYLGAILPSYVLTRERFTDPLLFSFLFKSSLSEVRKDLEYEWGLGWNLGYPKIDTPYDTIQRATSFFKILDDYIYLKLNQEFWMNRLDSSAPENLSVTHEPTGQTNQFAAKLLLANFGSYAQTMIQNPVNFNPVLTAIDKLTFQWVDIAGVQINNLDCEWNAAVQITEQVTQATPMSTIPRAPPAKK